MTSKYALGRILYILLHIISEITYPYAQHKFYPTLCLKTQLHKETRCSKSQNNIMDDLLNL